MKAKYYLMIGKIISYEKSMCNKYNISCFELCDTILMHPITFIEFIKAGTNSFSLYYHPNEIKLFGLNLEKSELVKYGEFKFVLK